ncbi:MAG: hypothetical protein HYR66_00845 [Sphingobacteriales bacterium]|nr:hypothetical protein [Sphingobacteriales bacterium]MBI3717431.1 hypothetical protein [Sphingobacteriales bacterium]
MLLQVSNPGSMSIVSLSFILWLIVALSVATAAVIYFIKHYNKSILWAHQMIDPLQHGLNRWNRQLNDWWQQNRGMHFFQKTNLFDGNSTYRQRKADNDSFAEELIDNLFTEDKKKEENLELNRLKEENELLLKQQVQLKLELHAAKTHNQQLLHEINELLQFRQLNQQLQTRINTLQTELNNATTRLMKSNEGMVRLNDEVNSLSGIEKDWIDAVNHAKDLELQVQKIGILEAEIKSLGAEREWLLIQLQQIKTKQLHEYEMLQETCNGLVEERNLLQNKMVMLESEVGVLSRTLTNNKQHQNEDVLWETKYITAAKELNMMRFQYSSMENEISALRNKEQLLREKAKQADGLAAQLETKQDEIIRLQRQLYECRKK